MFSRPFNLKSTFSAIAFCFLSLATSSAVNAETITFDVPPSPNSLMLATATFQGFTFSSVDSFNHVLSGHFSNAVSHNGTSFLVVSPGATGALVISNGGAGFTLNSFDADTFTHILGVTTITVTGTFVGGGTITQVITTDAVGDGPLPKWTSKRFRWLDLRILVQSSFRQYRRAPSRSTTSTFQTVPLRFQSPLRFF